MERHLKEGKSFGLSIKRAELSQDEIDTLTPAEQKGKTFDAEHAKKQLNAKAYQEAKLKKERKLDPSISAALENAERTLNNKNANPTQAREMIETIEKCVVENEIVEIELNHLLNVTVTYQPPETIKKRKCKGHSAKKKCHDAKGYKKKREKELASDPTIKSYEVYIHKNGIGSRDEVVSRWIHVNDAPKCDNYKKIKKETKPESWEEFDEWKSDLLNLDYQTCSLVNTTYGTPETRLINGREVSRPYWSKRQHLQCIHSKQTNCEFIKNKNCVFDHEMCTRFLGTHCLILEKFFKCRSWTQRDKPELNEIFGSDQNLWMTDYQPNQSFPEIATKLAVFDEMKKELQNSQVYDVASVRLFGGNAQQCSVSVADKLMYDCCEGMDGLATDVKLSKCTGDEIALAEAKKKGLSVYVGKKKEKFLGMWNSRTEHVYCIFPSKLSRVFQNEARKQLKMGWGDADHPDCRGLTQDEIKRLDFSKLDLLEAFTPPKPIDTTEKIRNMEERLKQRMEEISCS